MTTARDALPPCRPEQIDLPRLVLLLAASLLAASLLTWSGCSGGSQDDAEPAGDAAAPEGEAALPEGGMPGGAAAGAMSPDMAAAMSTPQEKEPPKPGAAPFDTTFLDVDTELFVFARLADVLHSSLVQTLTGGNLGPLDDVKRETGIDPREIASVTIGVRHLAQLVPSSGMPMGGMGGGMMPGAAGGMPGMGGPMPGMGGPMPGVNAGVPTGAATPAAGPSSTPGMVPGQMPAVGGAPGSAPAMPEVGLPANPGAGPGSTPGMVPGQMPAVGGAPRGPAALPETGVPAPGAGAGGPQFGGGMPASPDAAMMTMQGPTGGSPIKTPTKDVVAVIRTSGPIDTEALERGPVQKVPYGETSYYELRQPSGETVDLYLHDAQTLVVADETAIKQIIDRGDKRPRPTADLGFVKTAPHLLVAIVPQDKAALFGGPSMMPGMGMGAMSGHPGMQPQPGMQPMPGAAGIGPEALPADVAGGGRRRRHGEDADDVAAGPGAVPAAGAGAVPADATLFQQHADAYVLLVDLTSGIGLHVEVKCDTPAAAQTMQQVVKTSLDELRAQYDAAKPTLPGLIQKIAQPVVDALNVQTADTVVSVSTALPEEQQGSLAVLPAIVMGMMLSGGGLGGDFGLGGGLTQEATRELIIQEVVDDGRPAANSDELPAGVEVKGLIRWGESKYGEQAPAPLELDVAAVGGPAAQAVGYGKVTLTEAKTAEGTSLKWEGAASDQLGESPIAGDVPIERDGVFSEHPDDGVMVGILLTPPAMPATTLASVAGQFMMQVPASTEDVLVQNVASLSDGEVTNEKLTGTSMIVSLNGQGLVVTYNDSPLVGTIEPVTADGVPVETTVSSRSHGGGSKSLIFMFPAPPPNDLALRVTTHADLQEVAVPFRFEGLPLPKPQPLTEEQESLLVWTRADSPPEHPDLVIEAQGRWKTLEPVAALSDDAAPMGQDGFGFGMPPGSGFGQGPAADPYSGAGAMPDPAGDLGAGGLGVGVPRQGRGRRGRGRKGDDEEDQRPLPGSQPEQLLPGQLSPDGLPDGAFPGGEFPGDGLPGGGGASAGGSDQPLQIVIDLIGPLAESTEAVGKLHFSSAKTDIDTELAFEGGELSAAYGDPVEDFVPLESAADGQADGPPHGLRLIVKLTPPLQPIGSLSLLSGTVTLRTVRERTEAIIPNLQSRVGKPDPTTHTAAKPVSDRDLLRFGLKPVVAIEPNRIMMRLLEGKEERVADVSLVDHNGVPLKNMQATTVEGTGPAQGHTVYMFDFAGPIPQKIGMKVSVNMGVKDIEIPIRIHNLPLPPKPTDEG